MGYKFLSLKIPAQQLFKIYHVADFRQERSFGLLHGSHGNFRDAVGLEVFALGMETAYKAQAVDAQFGQLLGQPSHTIGVLGGSYGQMQAYGIGGLG